MRNSKKLLILFFAAFLLVVGVQVVFAAKPEGNPPSPWWSPRPETAQLYISAICGSGDPTYQAWCAWLTEHPEDVPASYYTPIQPPPSSTTVNLSEFDDMLIKATAAYLTLTDKAGLTESEMKDLTAARSKASGSTISLSGKGVFSGENLIDIYDKATIAAGLSGSDNICAQDMKQCSNGLYVSRTGSSCEFNCSAVNNVSAKALTPQAFAVRYGVYCGISSGESIKPGETKYYKIDMTKWIEWQRKYYEVYKNKVVERTYNMCLSANAVAAAFYNTSCDNGQLDPNAFSVNEYAAMVWANGTSCSAPDANYEQGCENGKQSDIAQANADLEVKEDLYKSGNYATVFSRQSGVGCNPYVGSAGCEDQDNIFEAAIGFDNAPVYESIGNFLQQSGSKYITGTRTVAGRNGSTRTVNDTIRELPAISASNLYAAVFNSVNGSGTEGGPLVGFRFDKNIESASEMYLMVHNKEGAARTFEFEMYCPDGKVK